MSSILPTDSSASCRERGERWGREFEKPQVTLRAQSKWDARDGAEAAGTRARAGKQKSYVLLYMEAGVTQKVRGEKICGQIAFANTLPQTRHYHPTTF